MPPDGKGVPNTETNVFMNPYKQPENKLTYSLLALLEHLAPDVAADLLRQALDVPALVTDISVRTLYGGGRGNPDGSFCLETPGKSATVFLESKTWRRQVDPAQIERHIKDHLKSSSDRLLIIVDERSKDAAYPQDTRVRLTTWEKVVKLAAELATPTRLEQKDRFLLQG